MLISGIVGTTALIGILITLLAAAAVLAYVDHRCDKNRIH